MKKNLIYKKLFKYDEMHLEAFDVVSNEPVLCLG